jgi:MarR family transcriptional regulator, 2-MHQ and catechol-resistance regulon repressor
VSGPSFLRNYLDIKIFDAKIIFMGTHYQGTPIETLALDSYIKLSRAAETVTVRINAHLLAEHHLTTSQFGVLEALYHLGPLHVGQLGEKILRSSGNMTLVIDNLARRDLVARRPKTEDRRCIEIHLTPAGAGLIEAIMPGHVAQVVTTMRALTAEEQQTLAALCRKLGRGQTNPPNLPTEVNHA